MAKLSISAQLPLYGLLRVWWSLLNRTPVDKPIAPLSSASQDTLGLPASAFPARVDAPCTAS